MAGVCGGAMGVLSGVRRLGQVLGALRVLQSCLEASVAALEEKMDFGWLTVILGSLLLCDSLQVLGLLSGFVGS